MNFDRNPNLDAGLGSELQHNLLDEVSKLLLRLDRVQFDGAVELALRRLLRRSARDCRVRRLGRVFNTRGRRSGARGDHRRLARFLRCALRLGEAGGRDGLDEQQRRIHEDRSLLAEAEADVPSLVHALRDAEEVAAVGARSYRGLERYIILQAGQVEVLAALLPNVQCAHLPHIVLPEPGLQHAGQMDGRPLGDK